MYIYRYSTRHKINLKDILAHKEQFQWNGIETMVDVSVESNEDTTYSSVWVLPAEVERLVELAPSSNN